MGSIWSFIKLALTWLPTILSVIRELSELLRAGDKKVVSAVAKAKDGDSVYMRRAIADQLTRPVKKP